MPGLLLEASVAVLLDHLVAPLPQKAGEEEVPGEEALLLRLEAAAVACLARSVPLVESLPESGSACSS